MRVPWRVTTSRVADGPRVIGIDIHADARLAWRGDEPGRTADQALGEQYRGTAVQDPERLARTTVDGHPTDHVVRAEFGELDAEVTDGRACAHLVCLVHVGTRRTR